MYVGWVLWRINICRFFNAKFCLYVYTFNQGFLNEYLVGKIFYKKDFICLPMIKYVGICSVLKSNNNLYKLSLQFNIEHTPTYIY